MERAVSSRRVIYSPLGKRWGPFPNLRHMGEGRDSKNMVHLACGFGGYSFLISGMHMHKNNDKRRRTLPHWDHMHYLCFSR